MADKLSAAAFAAKIKEKYPDYKNWSDADLVRAIVTKYPDYAERVDIPSLNRLTAQSADVNMRKQSPAIEEFQEPGKYLGFTPHNVGKNFKAGAVGAVEGLGAVAKDLRDNPNWIESPDGQHLSTFDKFLTRPALEQAGAAEHERLAGNKIGAFGHDLAAAIPGIGPWAATLGEQAGRGDVGGALGQGVGAYGAGRMLSEIPGTVIRLPGGIRSGLKGFRDAGKIPPIGESTPIANAADLEPAPLDREIGEDHDELPSSVRPIDTPSQAEHAASVDEEMVPTSIISRGPKGRIQSTQEYVPASSNLPLVRREFAIPQENLNMASEFRRAAGRLRDTRPGEAYGLDNQAKALENMERPWREVITEPGKVPYFREAGLRRLNAYDQSGIPGAGGVSLDTLDLMKRARNGTIKPIGEGPEIQTTPPDQLGDALRQSIDQARSRAVGGGSANDMWPGTGPGPLSQGTMKFVNDVHDTYVRPPSELTSADRTAIADNLRQLRMGQPIANFSEVPPIAGGGSELPSDLGTESDPFVRRIRAIRSGP